MPNVAMKHETDPKTELLKQIGDLSGFEIDPYEALVATYRRPEKTVGGIVLTRSTLEEDLYQSKVGLVVAIGENFICRLNVKLHDWVVLRPSDCWAQEVNFTHCRLVYGDQIRARITQPGMVW